VMRVGRVHEMHLDHGSALQCALSHIPVHSYYPSALKCIPVHSHDPSALTCIPVHSDDPSALSDIAVHYHDPSALSCTLPTLITAAPSHPSLCTFTHASALP